MMVWRSKNGSKVRKKGCTREAVKTLRFTDLAGRVDTDYPVGLCEGHAQEVRKFTETDIADVGEWLKTDSE